MEDIRGAGEKNVEPVIESASATTSPDNANSGNGAYIVFVIVAALLVVLVTGLSSCASALSDVAWRNAEAHSWGGNGYYYLDDDYYDDDWIEILDELGDYGHDTHYFSSWRAAR